MIRAICERELTLVPGRRYLAARPMFDGTQKLFPIFIHDIHDISERSPEKTVETLEGFTYDDANDFLAAFNNGPTSFDGRVW